MYNITIFKASVISGKICYLNLSSSAITGGHPHRKCSEESFICARYFSVTIYILDVFFLILVQSTTCCALDFYSIKHRKQT